MNIHFESRLTRQDLHQILKLQYALPIWVKILYFPLAAIFAWNIIQVVQQGNILFALLATLVITYPFWMHYVQTAQIARRTPEVFEPCSGTISEEGITVQIKETVNFIAWSKYVKIKRNENLILLYHPNKVYDYFLRSYFTSQADWDIFMAWIDRKLKDGTLQDMLAKPSLFFFKKR